jgi:diacylglycerol O-acyltransferase / wax synthase
MDPSRRLSTIDASFLYVEKPNQMMHIGGISIYEGHIPKSVMDDINARTQHLAPRFRQKVVFPPFLLAHPIWVDDNNFNPDNHTEFVELDDADDQAMLDYVAPIWAQVLPRDRPLHRTVVMYRPDNTTAIFGMTHHAMIDGVSGVDLSLFTHTLTPDAPLPPLPGQPWEPEPEPDRLTLLEDAFHQSLTTNLTGLSSDFFGLLRPVERLEQNRNLTANMETVLPLMLQSPRNPPWIGRLSNQRAWSWVDYPFSDVRMIRSVLGGTVNDVVLAIIAGGLGKYMEEHGYRSSGVVLRTMCPVSMRKANEHGQLGNLVSMMIAPLHVGIRDPVERLEAERMAMETAKERGMAEVFYQMTSQVSRVPPALQIFFSQLEQPGWSPAVLHTLTTNVPGPQVPIYYGGHKMLRTIGMGPLAGNMGLINAIGSYNQVLSIYATVDPTLVPDADFYAACLRESFDELLDAAKDAAPPEVLAASAAPVFTGAKLAPALKAAQEALAQTGANGAKAAVPARRRRGSSGRRRTTRATPARADRSPPRRVAVARR